jgi:hypothetical protein
MVMAERLEANYDRQQQSKCKRPLRCFPNKGKIRGWWRKFQNKEFHNLHSSPNITTVIM